MPGDGDRKEALDQMTEFMDDLKNGKEMGSYDLVKRTIGIMRRLIAHMKWTSTQDLLDVVRVEGNKIIASDPSKGCIGNMVRRVLKIIREEFRTLKDEINGDPNAVDNDSLPKRVPICGINQPCPMLKGAVIESIGELLTEIDGSVENISSQALEHIHADETIMTFGHSKIVEAFFKNAGRKRTFHVIICEGEPFFQGHTLAKNLTDAEIKVTLIPDTNAYAMMRKVNKVIIGTHTILAEGGCKVPCGVYNVAQAAKDHKVPLFVCASTYKLCPEQFISETHPGFQKWGDRSLFCPDDDFEMAEIEISTCLFEYVGPELIDLFIFNTGTNAPSHVYRLVKDIYHQDDLDLSDK